MRAGLAFAESPRWHGGRLWYSDFYRHAIYSLGPDGDDERVEVAVEGQPSGLAWDPRGRLLYVSMLDHVLHRVDPDGDLALSDLSEHCGFWMNDLCVGPGGTAYVGNFGFDLDRALVDGTSAPFDPSHVPTANLVVVSSDGAVLQVVPDMVFPNGMVLSPDGTTLVVAETLAARLSAFDVAASGVLSRRRLFASLERVAPDGMALDAEGAIWVADALRPRCLRVAPGGAVLDEVRTSQRAFACALGGANRRRLYIVTAPHSSRFEVATTRDGRIEACEVDVAGVGWP